MSNKLAKMSSLQRPNLLINSDFRSGIINQKGKLIYDGINGSKKYVIDMWYVLGNSTVTVKSNSVLVKNNQTTSSLSFSQYHNLKKGIYTLTVNVLSITGKVTTMTTASIPNSGMELKKGLNSVEVDLDKYILANSFGSQAIYFDIAVGASIEIEYIKLEQGLCFTGMPVWDETLELLKCQRHYIVIKNLKIALRGHTNQVFTSTFILPIRMKKSPTVTIEDTTNSYGVSNISGRADSNVLQISFKTLSDNMVDCRVNKVVLDAYDY